MLKILNKTIKIKNPFILFLPFLILYVAIVIIFPANILLGDQSRYITYAQYILSGRLPLHNAIIDLLGDGPGYSIILIPLVALHLPIFFIHLLNTIFFYLSIVLLYKILIKYTTHKKAFVISFFWGAYYNFYEYLCMVLSETFCVFLICIFILSLLKVFEKKSIKKYIYFTGFLLGFIALTKPIFGYVLICLLLGTGLLCIIKRKVPYYFTLFYITLIALATTLPYLIYTYNLTNKVFYWSSYGGNNLYWMSTPVKGEFGDWFRDVKTYNLTLPNTGGKNINGFEDSLRVNHIKDFEQISKLNELKKDDAFKAIAINNIKLHPTKFILNCFCNAGRLFFNYPYSYTLQKPSTLLRLPLNGIIFMLLLFCIIPTFINWQRIDVPIRFLFFFAFLYLGGSVLGSAETRMLMVIVPVLLILIGFVIEKTIKIDIKKWT